MDRWLGWRLASWRRRARGRWSGRWANFQGFSESPGSAGLLPRLKSRPGPVELRCRKPAGNGIRDCRSCGSTPRVPVSSLSATARGALDPEDEAGLFTVGDSAVDSPSVGDEELTTA